MCACSRNVERPSRINNIFAHASIHILRLSLSYRNSKSSPGSVCILPQAPRKNFARSSQSNACTPFVRGYSKERKMGISRKPRSRSSIVLPPVFMLRRPPAVYTPGSSSFGLAAVVFRRAHAQSQCLLFCEPSCPRVCTTFVHLALCVACILMCCFPAHSMYGFRTPPTMPIPSARKPSGSWALITLTGGSKGLSALTCAASLAACSMASISSLHAAWSKGHTTMGCRRRMSRADDNLAYIVG